MPTKFKKLNKMTKKELQDWKDWAQNEIEEYQAMIDDIDAELKKRCR